MRVYYTAVALRQLARALDYIEERSPQGARNVKARLQAIVDLLAEHPLTGQATDREGQRRIVTSPYPYVIFYRVRGDEVIIQRVRHTSRRPV